MTETYRGPSGKGPRIVAIGGGTGLSTMLRGLKRYTSNVTAIVTVADDGGGSGVLRQELGMLPPEPPPPRPPKNGILILIISSSSCCKIPSWAQEYHTI